MSESPVARGLILVQSFVAVAASLFIVGGVCATAILRYVFKTSLFGLDELILIAAFWMYFIGASFASSRKQHISAEIVSVYCPNRIVREVIGMVAETITLSLSVLYTYWGGQFIYWSITEGGVTPVFRLPLAISQVSIFVGFTLMTWYFLFHLVNRVRALNQNESKID